VGWKGRGRSPARARVAVPDAVARRGPPGRARDRQAERGPSLRRSELRARGGLRRRHPRRAPVSVRAPPPAALRLCDGRERRRRQPACDRAARRRRPRARRERRRRPRPSRRRAPRVLPRQRDARDAALRARRVVAGSRGRGPCAGGGRMVDDARVSAPALSGRSSGQSADRGRVVTLHPATLEVVRSALYAIAEEMSVIVMRSARSPLLKEAGDLSSALTDAEGRLIAQGRDIPIHMGVMAFTVKEFLKRVPATRLREGDVWFLNLPEVGGNHLPDVKAIRPIFTKGRLLAFAINLAHWADIGGAVPGSYVPYATEAHQEGVRISPLRLASADGVDREKLDFLLSNVRGREEREGDIFAQCAANDVAARRFAELVERYGADTLRACFDRLQVESETQMRAAIEALPDGVYEGE